MAAGGAIELGMENRAELVLVRDAAGTLLNAHVCGAASRPSEIMLRVPAGGTIEVQYARGGRFWARVTDRGNHLLPKCADVLTVPVRGSKPVG